MVDTLMSRLKELLLDIQARLKTEVPALWSDKDWWQFQYPQPPVKFPCALIDIETASFSDLRKGSQMADVNVVLTIAHQRLKSASVNAPTKEDGYFLLDMVGSVHKALQLHHAEWYAPLVRKGMRRIYIDNAVEVYAVTYGTAFVEVFETGETRQHPVGVKVAVNPVTEGIGFQSIEEPLEDALEVGHA